MRGRALDQLRMLRRRTVETIAQPSMLRRCVDAIDREQDRPSRLVPRVSLAGVDLAREASRCARVYVLSAAHGRMELDECITPYDQRVLVDRHAGRSNTSCAPGRTTRARSWRPCADTVATRGTRGTRRHSVRAPLAGLQVGGRLRWLNRQIAAGATP